MTTREAGPDAILEAHADFRAHVTALGLYRGSLDFQGSHVTEHAYPVYRVRDAARVRDTRERIAAWGIDLLGRQGRFEYATSSDVAAQAREYVRALSSEDAP